MRILKTKRTFRKEFKRQLRYAIAAAAGFLVIFAWRDAIINATRNIVERFVEKTQVVSTNILTALVITVAAVFVILISSKLLKD